MAKEMMIIFLYDLEYCKHEEDDPAAAILYFYPSWVSDQQRTNLCGQIMGTIHFLKSVFSCPKVLALQSGKFSIKEFGRYILGVGTDRNIDDSLLEYRAYVINSLITFFHKDIQLVSEQYQIYNNFKEKLYSMFETYLKILQYSGTIFANVPLLQLPKSANNVFLEAIQILQYCQKQKTVLGGTMLYHNKVVATQLSSDVTKRLVIADPYRIKSPAEVAHVKNLPLGVQLLYVYISSKEYKHLQSNAQCLQNLNYTNVTKNQQKKPNKPIVKEPVLSAMKRDQSLIFTTVPEEDIDHQSPTNSTETFLKNVRSIADRPKSLSLRSTTSDMKPKPLEKATNNVTTPFTGRTSVCSTPLAEKVLHGTVLSICNANIEFENELDNIDSNRKLDTSIESNQNTIETRTDSVNSILSKTSNAERSTKFDFSKFDKLVVPVTNMIAPVLDHKRSNSLLTNSVSNKDANKTITLRYYGIGLKNMKKAFDENDIKTPNNHTYNKHIYNTITDPSYPVFRSDGTVMSKYLYDENINKHCELIATEYQKLTTHETNMENSITNTDDWKSVDDFDTDMKDSPVKIKQNGDLPIEVLFSDNNANTQSKRRSLSLPLKSLTSEQNNENNIASFSQKRNLGGVQLTPLMSKLSLLALEEKSSGFCSRDTTPSEFRDFGLTPTEKSYSFLGRKSSMKFDNRQNSEDTEDFESSDDELQKVVLFICGQQDMVLGLLLEEDSLENSELIQKLWEICIETLGRLELQLRQCLDPYPVPSTDQSETYSYLCVDPQWDTTQRGGPWGVPELGSVTQLHRDFSNAKNITEITLRSEDGIVYGYRCGQTEVYYQQMATSNPGLPPPADSMGVVPLKARRKLERDHAVLLL